MTVRAPAVAGKFYESSAQALKQQIEAFADKTAVKSAAIACMLPHAGYMYSGRVAVETVSRISLPEKIILLGPNHTGNGAPFSLMAEGSWETPLGRVEIDAALAKKILAGSIHLVNDNLAHLDEHSLEVEIPIFQYFKNGFKIVPIAFMTADTAALIETGKEIAAVIQAEGIENSVLIAASSDMTHFERQQEAAIKDKAAIKAILELDEEQLMEKVRRLDISMCGW
ncbi:MAG: AmmeMemoRadiSam system protein B, partial [Candidatus Omnitrophota bacterium]|nr:AmmeMemoRadiSam system protein B [Candidatus Omnitrophota bacterium]